MKQLIIIAIVFLLSTPSVMAQPGPCVADFNCDGDVTGPDITTFLTEMNKRTWIGGDPCTCVETSCPCTPAPVPKTGQIISYRTGDDGYYQNGVSWPNPRFIDHGDGTVTDDLTGLIWMQDIALLGEMIWEDAVDACYNLDYAGYQDWRLPNLKTLSSLTDYSQLDPRIPSGHPFIGYAGGHDWCWSSTTSGGGPNNAQVFSLGAGDVGGSGKGYSHNCWCVRGSQ